MTQRPDRRYKDPDTAPSVVSEKRMTLFLADEVYRAVRLQAGYNRIANAEGSDGHIPLPESPSAAVYEAVQLWLDQFAPFKDQSRTPKEWSDRLAQIRRTIGTGKQ